MWCLLCCTARYLPTFTYDVCLSVGCPPIWLLLNCMMSPMLNIEYRNKYKSWVWYRSDPISDWKAQRYRILDCKAQYWISSMGDIKSNNGAHLCWRWCVTCTRSELIIYIWILWCYSVQYRGFNPNPCGWGRIWLPKLRTGITPQWLKLRKFLILMYSSENVSWVYLVKYFRAKNGVFGKL